MRKVVANGPPEELHAVLDAAGPPRLFHALDDLGLESQREDLHVDGLAVALARLARAHRDAALLGLADLPDEVTAVVAARRAADRLEVLRLQLLDAHRREASPHVRRRGRARVGRGALLRGRVDRGRRALGRGRLLRSGGERLLDAPDEELPVRAPRRLAQHLAEARLQLRQAQSLELVPGSLVSVAHGPSPRRAPGTRHPSRASPGSRVGLRSAMERSVEQLVVSPSSRRSTRDRSRAGRSARSSRSRPRAGGRRQDDRASSPRRVA